MNVKKRIVVLLCITAATLITIDVRGGSTGPLGAVRSGVREIFSPLQRGVSAMTDPVGDFFDGFFHAGELKDDNENMRREMASLKTKNKKYEAAANENERLKKLLDLTDSLDVDNTTARVITGSPSNFETTLQINKGSSSHISIGDAVISGDGLLGRVIEVSRSRATVLLITDSTSGVGVRNTRSEVAGIAQGHSGRSTLSMEFVDPDADIKMGDTIVTSGLQLGRFPPDIPFGMVSKVSEDPSGLTKNVTLTPIVNLSRVSIVSVLHTGKG